MRATILLIEVLQGFTSAQDFNQGKKLLTSLPMIELVGGDIAFQAANNFGNLRTFGITIRKTIDTFIATSCIEKGLALRCRGRNPAQCEHRWKQRRLKIREPHGLSADTAMRLARYFGSDARSWLNDLRVAEISSAKRIAREVSPAAA